MYKRNIRMFEDAVGQNLPVVGLFEWSDVKKELKCKFCGTTHRCIEECPTELAVGFQKACKISEMRKVFFWLGIPPLVQKIIVEFMDVQTLCRTDAAMTAGAARKVWLETLNGLSLVSLNEYPKYSNADHFKGLRWCMQRHIQLEHIHITFVHPYCLGDVPIDIENHFKFLCEFGYTDIIQLLVTSKSIDIDREGNGIPPLFYAARYGNLKAMQNLVEAGANINKKVGEESLTALMVASERGHVELVRYLLNSGASIDARDSTIRGATSLHIASESGHAEVVRVLIEAGASLNMTLDNRSTALYLACRNGEIGVVDVLLRARADINLSNDSGCSSLLAASEKGHLQIVRALILAGADVDKENTDGTTPLCKAAQLGHVEVVKDLLEAGAQVNKRTNNGRTPLIMASSSGHVEVVKALIEDGKDIDVDMVNKDGESPLFIACMRGHLDVLRVLIQANADVNKRMSNGWTPLYWACYCGQVSILEMLRQAGADEEMTVNDRHAIEAARERGHTDIVSSLTPGQEE